MIRKSTKDILAESFLELAKTKRIDKIRISDITDNCGMSQPTFYHYFKDKYDLMVWLHVRSSSEIMAKVGKNGYEWKDTLTEGAKSYYENRDFVLNALKHTSGQDSFVEYVRRINIELLTNEVRKKLMTEHIPDEILGIFNYTIL